MCFFYKKERIHPQTYYIDCVQNKSIDSAKQLYPPLTEDEKNNLMNMFHKLQPKAQEVVISNCIDSGAGTGILK